MREMSGTEMEQVSGGGLLEALAEAAVRAALEALRELAGPQA